MKAEDNLVDNWLKQSVKREIYFRLGAWSLFTIIAFYISFKEPTFELSDYAIPLIKKMLQQLNFVWKFLFYLMLIAFFLKDIRYSEPDKWNGDNIQSKAGMIATKLTCELLLWVGGASTALLVIISFSLPALLHNEPTATNQDLKLTILAITYIATLTTATLGFYYLLKIDRPLISKTITHNLTIKIVYAVFLAGTIIIMK